MNEVLTVAEIHARFPGEWVLLGEPQTDTHQGVQAGTMLCHGKDREEVYRKAMEVKEPRHIAIFYTGPVPSEGTELLLRASPSILGKGQSLLMLNWRGRLVAYNSAWSSIPELPGRCSAAMC